MKRVAVVGLRTFGDYSRLAADLDRIRSKWGDFVVVTGCAKGADSLAVKWARERDLPFVIHRADWATHGLAAGPLRNAAIVAYADCVVAFWDGKSRGTGSTVRLARKAGKPVFVRPVS